MFAPTNPAAVLNDLMNEGYSLPEVAQHHSTTVADLAAWLELPAIAQQFAAVTTLAAKRAHALATIALNSAARALHEIVNDLENPRLNLSYNPANPKDTERRRRQFDLVRRAAWLLYLISRTTGDQPRQRPVRLSPAPPPSSPPSRAIDVAPATSMQSVPSPSPPSAPPTKNGRTSSPYALAAAATGSHTEQSEAPTNAQLASYEPEAPSTAPPASALCDNSAHTLTTNHAAPLRPP